MPVSWIMASSVLIILRSLEMAMPSGGRQREQSVRPWSSSSVLVLRASQQRSSSLGAPLTSYPVERFHLLLGDLPVGQQTTSLSSVMPRLRRI